MVNPNSRLENIFQSLDQIFASGTENPKLKVDNQVLNRIPNRIMAKYLDSRQHLKGDQKIAYKNALMYYKKQTPPQKRITAFFKATVQGDNKLLQVVNKEKVISEIADSIEGKLDDFLKDNHIIDPTGLDSSAYRGAINDFAKDMADLIITDQISLNQADPSKNKKFYKSLSVFFRKVTNQSIRDNVKITTMSRIGTALRVKRGIIQVNKGYESELNIIDNILDHLLS